MRRAVLCLVLILLSAGGIARSTTLEEDFPLEGTMRLGPLRLRPFILIKDTGYDDNVFLENTRRVSDFTSTVEPGAKLLTLFADRAALLVEERLDYVWFAQTISQNHFNNNTRAQANFYLKRITLFGEVNLLSYRERPSTEIDFRIRRHENFFGAGIKYERPRSSLEARLGQDDYRYASGTPQGVGIPDALNRTETRLTLTGREKVLPKTTFLLEWEGRTIGFDEQAGQVKDSTARRISGGFEFDPTAFLRGSVKVGVESLRPDEENQRGFRGMVGEGNLLYRITGVTNLEGRGRRNTGFTVASGNVYFVDTAYGTTLTQFLAERVAAEVGADRERVDYPEVTTLCDLNAGSCASGSPGLKTGFRTDEMRSYFVGGSYRFSNQTRVGLRVGIWERDSTFDFLNRRRTTAQVTYTYNF